MTDKHTPGPWEAYVPENGAVHVDATCGMGVCDLYHVERNGPTLFTKDNAEANARLIAAAPDLLEALKWCEQVYGHDWPANASIRETIAKAEGKAND